MLTEVSTSGKVNFTSILAIRFIGDLECYLGFHLVVERVKKTDFDPLLERIQGHLASLKSCLLNKAGKLHLAQSVLFAISMYTMQCFLASIFSLLWY